MGKKLFKILAALSLVFFTISSFAIKTEAATSMFVTKGSTSSKVVALTFDDGSDGTNINSILRTLAANNVKSTFFLTGSGAQKHPNSIKNIVNHGHEVANHSYSHPDFTKLTAAQMKTELDKTEATIKKITGKSTKPLFRAPYGSVNSAVLRGVGNAGYTHTIHWNIDTVDWKGISSKAITDKVVNNIAPGSIVLMHTGAGASGTVGALPGMISKLKAKGYSFVTISQLLKLKQPISGTTYTVKSGDTLYSISRKFNVSVAKIAAANNITNYSLIKIGQVLTIPKAVTSPPAAVTKYTVKSGDTLYSISRKFNISVSKIAAANNITNYSFIKIGQVLIIPKAVASPPPVTVIKYTVKSGDTLYSISRKYGTTVAKIAAANKISSPYIIRVGQVLTIPK